jgi:metal-sulfur cluster biosynthetic enzyme
LPNEVKNSIIEVKGVKKVDLDLVWEPPWDKSMMSESAKLELNL